MNEIAFDLTMDKEKRESAMNNLLVLARERAGAELIFNNGVTEKIMKMLKLEKNETIITAAVRIVAELCIDNPERTDTIMKEIGIPWILEMINSEDSERVNSGQYLMQVGISSFLNFNLQSKSAK